MKNELWLIWKEPQSRIRYKIGTLIYKDNKYIFKYINPELEDAKSVGFAYFPGFNDTSKTYTSNKLFANIQTRLPNVKRPDYLEILNYYNLNVNSSSMEILKATRGRLITDNYEFVTTFDNNEIEFDVATTRYCKDIKKCGEKLVINDKLYLELEPTNLYDKYAIKIIYIKDKKRYHLGYVPRYYSKQLTELLNKNVSYSAMIKSINLNSSISDEHITAIVKVILR